MARETGAVNDEKKPDANAPEDVTEIKENIERTRAQMSDTIGALQEKLNPTVLKERLKEELAEAKEAVKVELAEAKVAVVAQLTEAKEAVKSNLAEANNAFKDEVKEQYEHARDVVHDATIGRVETIARTAGDTMKEAKTTIVDTIRANPIPAAMAGIGLAWLFMNRGTKSTTQQYAQYPQQGGGSQNRGVMGYATRVQHLASDTMHDVGDKASHVASAARHEASHLAQGAGQMMHDARDQADHVMHRAGEIAHQVQGQAGQLVHQAQDQMGHLADNARGTARRAEASIGATFQENPLALGAVALALGTAVGLALPKTRIEDDLLGETRDGFLERAGEMAHGMVGKAQEAAEQLMTGETEGGTHDASKKASADGNKDGGQHAQGGQQSGQKPDGAKKDGQAETPRTGEGARRALS